MQTQKQKTLNDQTRIWVELKLLANVQKRHPETKGMTYTGLVDWALRLLAKEAQP